MANFNFATALFCIGLVSLKSYALERHGVELREILADDDTEEHYAVMVK